MYNQNCSIENGFDKSWIGQTDDTIRNRYS